MEPVNSYVFPVQCYFMEPGRVHDDAREIASRYPCARVVRTRDAYSVTALTDQGVLWLGAGDSIPMALADAAFRIAQKAREASRQSHTVNVRNLSAEDFLGRLLRQGLTPRTLDMLAQDTITELAAEAIHQAISLDFVNQALAILEKKFSRLESLARLLFVSQAGRRMGTPAPMSAAELAEAAEALGEKEAFRLIVAGTDAAEAAEKLPGGEEYCRGVKAMMLEAPGLRETDPKTGSVGGSTV
jgi:hypothetical protein